jgi:hypothetical protein
MDENESAWLKRTHDEHMMALDLAVMLRTDRDLAIVDIITDNRATAYEVAKLLKIAESTVGRIMRVNAG